MSQSKSSQGVGSHKTDQPADCRQSSGGDLLSQCLTSKDGVMQLSIPGHVIPDFLAQANTAVNTGRISQARELLNDSNIEIAWQMATENSSYADIIYLMLGVISQKLGQLKDALKWYERILEHQQNALVVNEIATIYQTTGRYSEAVEYRKKAMKIEPDNIGIWGNFAIDLMTLGKAKEGIELLARALEKNPANSSLHSALLWHMHYLPDQDPQMLFEEHKRWGQMHTPISMAKTSHEIDPDPDRRLRIGYLSPDFREHSTTYIFKPFLDEHNREVVEVYGYGNVAKQDKVTEQLKCKFDHYRSVHGMDDKALVNLIEQDKIDILVEIGGRVENNRLMAMAYKPAPIQVDCCGINTTGMRQVDYRITDSVLDPPHLQKYYVEESIYLPRCFICYAPPEFAPPVASLPAQRNGYITFGSFNSSLKINRYILSLWAQVLKANDKWRFLMKVPGGQDQKIKDIFLRHFMELDISPDRIQIHGFKPSVEHLKLYGQVDIALDTYPFNGCITTLEGLWMGVPMVSLVGENSLLSRIGLSILSRIGMEFFSASTPAEFLAKATTFAQNLPALAKIRASLRHRMAASTLCDAKGYAGSVETAYRKMWHRWCRNQGVDVPDEESDDGTEACGISAELYSQDLTEATADTLEEM